MTNYQHGHCCVYNPNTISSQMALIIDAIKAKYKNNATFLLRARWTSKPWTNAKTKRNFRTISVDNVMLVYLNVYSILCTNKP